MSLGITLATATTGLNAAQANLRVISDNIANVNTPGYVRKAVDQAPLVVQGDGQGVRIEGVRRVTDQYLQSASLAAASDAKRWDAVAEFLDNAQSLFGDPAGNSFFFNRLDKIYGALASIADDPTSTLLRSQALANTQDFLSEAGRINAQITSLRDTVETRTSASVARANDLLREIDGLNNDIVRAKLVGADSSGAENIQSQLLDELSSLMNVRLAPHNGGGVDVRSHEGVLLAGAGAATLTYTVSTGTQGYITAQPAGSTSNQAIQIISGEIRGLLDLRDVDLPKIADQLGEFMSQAVDRLNAAHNDAAAFPPPATLTGRNTGLDLPSALNGFAGATTVALVDANGVLQHKVDIDFSAGTMALDGGASAAFTPANFLATLNATLGGLGSATFTGGVLTLNAAGGAGLAIDEGTSQKTGRGFSHFFGLNDLVRANGFTNYATGLAATDPHGFTAGGVINLRMSSADGRPLRDIAVTVPGAPLMSDLINSLNNAATGVGLYGSFSLDADGVLTFAGAPPTNAVMSVTGDNTQRGAGGPSISQLFGLGDRERSGRASRFAVDPALAANPSKMAVGQADVAVALGQIAIRPGDGQGALALSQSGDQPTLFQAAGSLGRISMTVSRYASEFGGAIGRGAASAETRKSSAEAISREADARRQAVEGVNLDEELVNLTTYQQAFSAAARMIQATSELFDVLLGIV